MVWHTVMEGVKNIFHLVKDIEHTNIINHVNIIYTYIYFHNPLFFHICTKMENKMISHRTNVIHVIKYLNIMLFFYEYKNMKLVLNNKNNNRYNKYFISNHEIFDFIIINGNDVHPIKIMNHENNKRSILVHQ